jgi:hypothetical protein
METLAVVEILGRRGEVVAREKINSLPASIGRGFDCDIILDDEFVAPRHLHIDVAEDGGFRVSDLGTVNRFSVVGGPSGKSNGAASVSPGQTIRLGHSQIRIWRPDSPVAPELAVLRTAARSWIEFIVWVSAAIGIVALYSWVGATGTGRDGTITYATMMTAVAMLGWSGLWWISSRHAHKGDTFLAHTAIAGGMVCLVLLGDLMANSLAFAFDLYNSPWNVMADFTLWAALSFSVYRHLRLVSRKRKWLLGTLACFFVAALLIPMDYANKEQNREKLGELEIPSSLRPSWMRVVDGVSPEKFFE